LFYYLSDGKTKTGTVLEHGALEPWNKEGDVIFHTSPHCKYDLTQIVESDCLKNIPDKCPYTHFFIYLIYLSHGFC